MSDAAVVCSSLSFAWPDDTPVFKDLPFGRLSTLSGGRAVSLGLAAQLLKRPDVLLPDEPADNLELVSAGRLPKTGVTGV